MRGRTDQTSLLRKEVRREAPQRNELGDVFQEKAAYPLLCLSLSQSLCINFALDPGTGIFTYHWETGGDPFFILIRSLTLCIPIPGVFVLQVSWQRV